MLDANRQVLLAAARLLGPLLDEIVFVGGCATGLLITDDAVPGVRATLPLEKRPRDSRRYAAWTQRSSDSQTAGTRKPCSRPRC